MAAILLALMASSSKRRNHEYGNGEKLGAVHFAISHFLRIEARGDLCQRIYYPPGGPVLASLQVGISFAVAGV
ncbi:MAG TPA: hypothetical protein VN875_12040 [Candidatus Binatus sp.]|nr:hypothetical protein [Candidatus Binatus sp.]